MNYPCYYYRKDNRGEWRWTYFAANGETIAVSSEGYRNKADCRHAITLMQGSSNDQVYVSE